MLKTDSTGRSVLQYTVTGRIRRLPLPTSGTSKKGFEWKRGSVVIEVMEDGVEGSAELYLVTFDEFLIEELEMIGIGKNVKATFHIDVRSYYDSYNVSCILDAIEGLSESESFLYNTKKK
mgnify:CR=1 FL=1